MSVQVRMQGVYFIRTQEYAKIRGSLRRKGTVGLEIPGEVVNDASDFFHVIKTKLPLDPPLSGVVNLDAFADSLWEGISCLDAKTVAVM